MENRCPGRTSSAVVDTTLIVCSGCSNTLEIFGDETRVHCRCGQWVFRDVVPSCAQWCKEAERCFGRIANLPKALKDSCAVDDLKEQEARLRDLQGRVAVALAKCSRPELQQRGRT